jgi:hypothetical protein
MFKSLNLREGREFMKSNGDERKSSGGHFLVIKKTILMSKDVI